MMHRTVRFLPLLIFAWILEERSVNSFSHLKFPQTCRECHICMSVHTKPTGDDYDIGDLEDDPIEEGLSKKEFSISASIDLPFEADVAFNAFVDLTRQPSWSPWIRSVTYIDEKDSPLEYSSCGIPLRQTKWTIGVRGLKFSWKAISTIIERPSKIEWESISGLKNRGSVSFIETENGTEMTLAMKFVAPRIVSGMLRKSSRITSFANNMLSSTLSEFSRVVMEEDLK